MRESNEAEKRERDGTRKQSDSKRIHKQEERARESDASREELKMMLDTFSSVIKK